VSVGVTAFQFGEWLPDQPDFGRNGLVVCQNVWSYDGHYIPFNTPATFSGTGYTMPAAVIGVGYGVNSNGNNQFYAGTSDRLYSATATTMTAVSSTLTAAYSNEFWDFAQYENLMFAGHALAGPLFQTIGSLSNFTALTGAAPSGRVLSIVGQFLVVGNLTNGTFRPSGLQWSAIDDPTNFPTVNSATAIATQSGSQILDQSAGGVQDIIGGDQFGVIFQKNAITRMTYVGPPVVFQFDKIDPARGLYGPKGAVKVGQIIYFVSSDGFYMTDGVSVIPIGQGKADKTFLAELPTYQLVFAGYEKAKKSVVWMFPRDNGTNINTLYTYNIETKRFTRCIGNDDITMTSMVTDTGSVPSIFYYDTSNVLKYLNGTPATAILTTGDIEVNPGGRTLIDKVKPHVEHTTTPSVSVRVGFRNDLYSAVKYTGTTAPSTETGFAYMRSYTTNTRPDGKYHRVEVQISGNFQRAVGFEADAMNTGIR
jgi:hypothetical protein